MSGPKLTRPLVLEAPAQVADGAGGFSEAWTAKGTLWAEVKPRTGREVEGPGLTLSRVGYRITVRGAPQGAPSRPVAGQRFRYGARVFHIRAVTEADPSARFLVCFAEEEVVA